MSPIKRLQKKLSQIKGPLSPKKLNFGQLAIKPEIPANYPIGAEENMPLLQDEFSKSEEETDLSCDFSSFQGFSIPGSSALEECERDESLEEEGKEEVNEEEREQTEEMVYCEYLRDLYKSGKTKVMRAKERNDRLSNLVVYCIGRLGGKDAAICDVVGTIVDSYRGEVAKNKILEKKIATIKRCQKELEQLIHSYIYKKRILLDILLLRKLEESTELIPQLETKIAREESRITKQNTLKQGEQIRNAILLAKRPMHQLLRKLSFPGFDRTRSLLVLQPSQRHNTENSRPKTQQGCQKMPTKTERPISTPVEVLRDVPKLPMSSVERALYPDKKTSFRPETSPEHPAYRKWHAHRPSSTF